MARANLFIKEGSYAGTGVAQAITGLGFRPDLVIIKGGANSSVFRTKHLGNASVDNTPFFGANTAATTNLITEIQNDGFAVGTAAQVNTNATTYYYVALKGADAQTNFRALYYRGTGAGSRSLNTIGLGFTPDFFTTKKEGSDNPAFVTLSVPALSAAHWSGVADATGEIDAIIANGVTLNTSTRTNAVSTNYYGFAFKNLAGVMKTGSFVGTAKVNQVTGLGFKPDILLLKNSATTDAAFFFSTTVASGGGYNVGAAGQDVNTILSLDTDGFTVGTSTKTNGSGNTVYYTAFKNGTWNAPVTRLSA